TVITNVAAINMEEVIPLNVNDSNLLAPEEIYDKKNVEVKGETELTSADKKNARVKKKRAKKKEKKMREREEKVMEKYVSLIIFVSAYGYTLSINSRFVFLFLG